MMPKDSPANWLGEAMSKLRAAHHNRAQDVQSNRPSLNHVTLHKALLEAGVGRRHANYLVLEKELEATSALKAVKEFQADPKLWCLVLAGSRGVGKTLASEWLLAQSLAANLSRRPCQRHIFSSLQVMRARHDDRLQHRMCGASLLLLDDLGVEIPDSAGGFMWCLFEILNQRWANGARTVITTNLSPSALHCRYGKRVTDRLADGGRCVVLKGQSLRRVAH